MYFHTFIADDFWPFFNVIHGLTEPDDCLVHSQADRVTSTAWNIVY